MELLRSALGMLLRGVFSGINMRIGFLDLIYDWDNVMFLTLSSREIQEAFSKTSHSTLIRHIQQLLLETNLWEFEHIPKEENVEAD
ncbi:hypothetical protein Goari_005502, partial [Gossypium aridum]|nr:hypothetical protein [Gossypium aridum]